MLSCNDKLVTIQLATGNPVDYWLTSTVDKTHHGLVIAPFSKEILKRLQKNFLAMLDLF